jgi:glycosyltransferase involved in cell wall biosynthesis
LVTDGETGVLVEPRNWEELGDRMDLLLSDPNLRTHLGKKALDRAKSCFTWEKVADRLQGIYLELRKTPGGGDHN